MQPSTPTPVLRGTDRGSCRQYRSYSYVASSAICDVHQPQAPATLVGIVRSTPEQDVRLRLRLAAAVEQFAGGSADKFGQLIGYANGGYVREVLNEKKPVREKMIERVHARKEMAGWFNSSLTQISIADVSPESSGPASQWPFRRISLDQWSALDGYDQALVEDAAFSRLRELQAQTRSSSAAVVQAMRPGTPQPDDQRRGGLRLTPGQAERRRNAQAVELDRRHDNRRATDKKA